jgi:hypothetical protein
MENMVRTGRKLVEKYHLGEPAGEGVQILESDISALAQAVHAIPDYRPIGENEILAADRVSLSEKQTDLFLALQKIRQAADDTMRQDIEEMLTMGWRDVSHENWVTSDGELLTIFSSHGNGGIPQQKTATQKLLHIFSTIDQNSAVRLSARISTLKLGDMVSQRFQAVFPLKVRESLLKALQR